MYVHGGKIGQSEVRRRGDRALVIGAEKKGANLSPSVNKFTQFSFG